MAALPVSGLDGWRSPAALATLALGLVLPAVTGHSVHSSTLSDLASAARNCVVYVKTPGRQFSTGFLVTVREGSKEFLYLVTARHVLYPEGSNDLAIKTEVRINTRSGGGDTLAVSLFGSGDNKNVFFHEDKDAVDIAVVRLTLATRFDYKALSMSYFIPTEKEIDDYYKIQPLAECFYWAFFPGVSPGMPNSPMAGTGKLARLSKAKITVTNPFGERPDHPRADPAKAPPQDVGLFAWLFEFQSFPGTSGSPVFLVLDPPPPPRNTGNRLPSQPGPPPGNAFAILGGVLIDEVFLPRGDSQATLSALPSGRSLVAPSYKLREILDGEELRAQRRPRH